MKERGRDRKWREKEEEVRKREKMRERGNMLYPVDQDWIQGVKKVQCTYTWFFSQWDHKLNSESSHSLSLSLSLPLFLFLSLLFHTPSLNSSSILDSFILFCCWSISYMLRGERKWMERGRNSWKGELSERERGREKEMKEERKKEMKEEREMRMKREKGSWKKEWWIMFPPSWIGNGDHSSSSLLPLFLSPLSFSSLSLSSSLPFSLNFYSLSSSLNFSSSILFFILGMNHS